MGIINVYNFDSNGLAKAGLVDSYESLIWTKRFYTTGDCELYLPASDKMVELLVPGRFLLREDDEMICRITRVELTTSHDGGDHLIVTGEDATAILGQRIIWNTANCYGNVETFVRKLITDNLISPARTERTFPAVTLGAAIGMTDRMTCQVSYRNLGETIREYQKAYHFGIRAGKSGANIELSMYAGRDLRTSVIFCEEYENLAETDYSFDSAKDTNVALVAGEGEGATRAKAIYGYSAGEARRELFVDADTITSSATYEDMTEAYPPGASGETGYIDEIPGTGAVYKMHTLNVTAWDDNQSAWLDANYPGGTWSTGSDGKPVYTLTDVIIADLTSTAPEDYDPIKYRDLIYYGWLASKGAESLQTSGDVKTFNGSIVPDVTFVYGRDYYLGDIVLVRNRYGIEAAARVSAVTEVHDASGRRVEPTFSYTEPTTSSAVPSGAISYYTPAESLEATRVASLTSAALRNLAQAAGAANEPTATTAGTMTKVPLVAAKLITIGTGFSISDGGIQVAEAGHYIISGAVYMAASDGSGVTRKTTHIYHGTASDTFSDAVTNNLEEMSGTDAVSTNGQAAPGAICMGAKLVTAEAGDVFWLACRTTGGAGSFYAGNLATFLMVERIEPAPAGGGGDDVIVTQNSQTGALSIVDA